MFSFLTDFLYYSMFPKYEYGYKIPIHRYDECVDMLMLKHNQICIVEKIDIVISRHRVKAQFVDNKTKNTCYYKDMIDIKKDIKELEKISKSGDFEFMELCYLKIKAKKKEIKYLHEKMINPREKFESEFYRKLVRAL